MGPLIAVTWLFCLAIWAYAATKVARRIMDTRAGQTTVRNLREFTNMVARDCQAGVFIPDAVHAAADILTNDRLAKRLRSASNLHRLGGPIEHTGGDVAELQHFMRLWSIANRTGIGFSDLADTLVRDMDSHMAHHSKTNSAMAGARMTVLVLIGLPVGAIILGQGMGLGTVDFYSGNILGALLGLAGTVLAAAGVLWTESLTATVLGGVGRRAGPLEAARTLDIVATALRAGASLVSAWELGLGDQDHDVARRALMLLKLGAGSSAWDELSTDRFYGPIARMSARQASSGTRLAESMVAQASYLRAVAADQATEGAEKVLVVLAAPLTLCFLPAFVLTGLVPLAVGLAGFS